VFVFPKLLTALVFFYKLSHISRWCNCGPSISTVFLTQKPKTKKAQSNIGAKVLDFSNAGVTDMSVREFSVFTAHAHDLTQIDDLKGHISPTFVNSAVVLYVCRD